jgi:Transposase DDE domain group 1
MMSTGEPRCSENEQVRFGGGRQKKAILAPRWRPTLPHGGFGEQPGETGRQQCQHRAPGRLSLTAWADHGPGGSGEPLAIMLRPGNAGSNTAADHIEVTRLALAQLPAALRRKVLIRADSGGGTHDFLAWLTARSRRLHYSVGMTITEAIQDAIGMVPADAWTPAYDGDGKVREGATGHTAKGSLPVTLTAATVHTELVLDTAGGGIEVVNVVDAAGPGQPPVGGVTTGFGGTAPHGPGSPLAWIAVIGAGALLALVGGLRLRRDEPHRVTTRA